MAGDAADYVCALASKETGMDFQPPRSGCHVTLFNSKWETCSVDNIKPLLGTKVTIHIPEYELFLRTPRCNRPYRSICANLDRSTIQKYRDYLEVDRQDFWAHITFGNSKMATLRRQSKWKTITNFK